MSETWYVNNWNDEVEAVEIDRYTNASVWINGRRSSRKGTWRCYFPTASEAWDALETTARNRVDADERSLRRARKSLEELLAKRRRFERVGT